MRSEDLLDFESGRPFGRYTLVKRLSVGGMAEVFLALALGPGDFRKFVTLKRILPRYRTDSEFVNMFLEEARISASLSHANIAQVFDLGIEADELYLAMEFVPGEDLQQIAKAEGSARSPFGFTAMVIRDALLALHHAHTFVDTAGIRAPIVHRDVSPRNVMVTYAGHVKMIDFGIAKAMGPLGTGAIMGSAGYLTPEQIRGDTIDARTDVFAAGILLHERLTGRRLFPSSVRGEVVPPKPSEVVAPHKIDPAIPGALSDVAIKALAFDIEQRWQSARDMARAIELAAGDTIWEEDRAASYMQSLFRENLERTRTVVRLAARRAPTKEMLAASSAPDRPTAVDGNPIEPDEAQTMPLATTGQHDSRRRPIVVAVDDSMASLQLLKYQLSGQGIDVVCCARPAEALEVLGSSIPDAMILDVMMPELDGFELCKRIRALPVARALPILFLSAACDLDERTKCLDAGGDDFIRKPYIAEELAARLRSHLGRTAMIGPVD